MDEYGLFCLAETGASHHILLPLKKSFLDHASNRLARTISQIRMGPGSVDIT
jgi:hypothetical protein